jgi:hypothetical protein
MTRKWVSIFIPCIFLAGCVSSTPNPEVVERQFHDTLEIIPLKTEVPTFTPQQPPSMLPVEGILFFDLNGSGLRDQASFALNFSRLTDEKQPLQDDLLRAINVYVATHPELKEEEIITIEEPGLSGFSVCYSGRCATTDADGVFYLPEIGDPINIQISDPNSAIPSLGMRYINHWKGLVTVPEFLIDADPAIMESLITIPFCENNTDAKICIHDEDALLVREQLLYDTELIPLDVLFIPEERTAIEIGLVQGFLTAPFIQTQNPTPHIQGFFDIIGYRVFNDTNTYFSTQDGVMLNYDGKYNGSGDSDYANADAVGVGDSHTGLDYAIPIGSSIVSASPTSEVWYMCEGGKDCNDELRINTWFPNPENSSENYGNAYGHLNVILVEKNQTVYRGQIIGISGNSGYSYPYERTPMLHFHLERSSEAGWNYHDIYRTIVEFETLPENYWGSSVSYWTSDNNPIFFSID